MGRSQRSWARIPTTHAAYALTCRRHRIRDRGGHDRAAWLTGGGFDPFHFAALLRGEDIAALPPYELASGTMALGAVVVTVDNDGTTRAIERVS